MAVGVDVGVAVAVADAVAVAVGVTVAVAVGVTVAVAVGVTVAVAVAVAVGVGDAVTSSSAPMSGVVALRVWPSKSMVMPPNGTPILFAGLAAVMCRSVSDTKRGSALMEAASPPEPPGCAACQVARVLLLAAAVPSHWQRLAGTVLNSTFLSEALADQPVAAALVLARATWNPVPPERLSAKILSRKVTVAVLLRLKA